MSKSNYYYKKPESNTGTVVFIILSILLALGIFFFVAFGSNWFKNKDFISWYNYWGAEPATETTQTIEITYEK